MTAFKKTYAQPANNTCAGAINITVGAGCTSGTVVGATTEGLSTPSCWGGNPSNYSTSVWYTFSATDDSITINFGDGTLGAQALGVVYTSCAGTTELGCAKGSAEIELTGLTVGSTYYIMVDGAGTNTGTFCISAYETPPPPPPLGTCANPRTLYPASDCNNTSGLQYDEQNNIISTSGSTDGGASMSGTTYTNSTYDASCAGSDVGQQSYWVEFIAAAPSQTFQNLGSAALDYAVYSGTCATGLTAMSCTSINGGSSATISGLTANTKYMVMITPTSTSSTTTAYLCITGTAYVNPDDDCGTATAISTGVNYVLNTSNATVDYNNTLCEGSTENNIWVKWTADFSGTAYVNLQDQDCSCGNGTQMSIFNANSSCPSSGTGCILYINPNNDNDFLGQFTATSGSTYYIQIDGYAGCGCTFNFCITSTSGGDCSILLPITLLDFNLTQHDKKIKLSWITGSERNNDFFTIERSENSINFIEIAKIKAVGYSSQMLSYAAYDELPIAGISYYRLKQTDFDGRYEYSDIKAVSFYDSEKFNIIPTPSEENIKIIFLSDAVRISEVKIYDVTGRIVMNQAHTNTSGFNEISLNISAFEKGIYFVVLENGNKITQNKLIKK